MGKILLPLIFLLTSFHAFSQEKGVIRGTITDAEMFDEPLLFAHVSLKSTTHSIQTNFHGNFELTDITAGDYILFVQYPGYENLEIPISVKEDQVTRIDHSLQARKLNMYEVAETEGISSTSVAEPLSSVNK